MSHRTSSSTRVRFFRPFLECLEERNLLSNTGYLFFLSNLRNVIQQDQANYDSLSGRVNANAAIVSNDPKSGFNVVVLAEQSIQLIQLASKLETEITIWDTLAQFGETSGLLSNISSTMSPLSASPDVLEVADAAVLAQLQADVPKAELDFIAAMSIIAFGPSKFDLPTVGEAIPIPTVVITSNGVNDTITPPPAEAAANVGTVSLGAIIQNGGNSTVNLLETCTGSDGGKYTLSDSCTNSTIQDTLTVPASAAGVTDTWNVAVTGLPTQTYQTVFA